MIIKLRSNNQFSTWSVGLNLVVCSTNIISSIESSKMIGWTKITAFKTSGICFGLLVWDNKSRWVHSDSTGSSHQSVLRHCRCVKPLHHHVQYFLIFWCVWIDCVFWCSIHLNRTDVLSIGLCPLLRLWYIYYVLWVIMFTFFLSLSVSE